jgi:hypothetical protein
VEYSADRREWPKSAHLSRFAAIVGKGSFGSFPAIPLRRRRDRFSSISGRQSYEILVENFYEIEKTETGKRPMQSRRKRCALIVLVGHGILALAHR